MVLHRMFICGNEIITQSFKSVKMKGNEYLSEDGILIIYTNQLYPYKVLSNKSVYYTDDKTKLHAIWSKLKLELLSLKKNDTTTSC